MILQSVNVKTRLVKYRLIAATSNLAAAQDVTDFVNPFIGTANGGNTFPGVVRPWGMVSASPHTTLGAPSGYLHGEKHFYGIGHVHLSGTACAELGSVIVMASRGEVKTDPNDHKCTYSDEQAEPGFYRVTLLEPSLQAEVTATLRCGMTRLTSLRDGEINVLIDAGRSLSLVGGGAVAIRSDTEIEGYNTSGGFCGEANRQRVYFVARLSEPARAYGSTRFMRPRLKNGNWLTPFDPLQTEGSGSWAGSGGPGYVEGNAWNYTWFVPHDINGLIDLFGGRESFITKLQQCFDDGHFTITNEPDIGYPYLFSYLSGEERRTQRLVRDI